MTDNRSPLTNALKACYPALGTTFILSMFINAAMLASPLYSMQVYDRVLTSRNISTLVMLTLIVGVFLVLYGVLEFTRSGVLARAGRASPGASASAPAPARKWRRLKPAKLFPPSACMIDLPVLAFFSLPSSQSHPPPLLLTINLCEFYCPSRSFPFPYIPLVVSSV